MNWSKRNKFAGVAALALVLVATAIIGFAQGGRGGFGKGHGRGGDHHRGGFGHVFRSLNLTEAQRTQIKEIAGRNRQSTASLREQLRTNHKGMAGVPNMGTFDEQAVRVAAQARAAAHVELEVAHARMFSEMYAVLTPEQKAQLAAQRQKREQRRQERQQRRNAQRGGTTTTTTTAPTTEQ